ncbi:hypothetical protein FRC11_005195 [Ceratobasidium sp. 423]|nr:hypothetical protein FRC11_005195 [Ceratobasidium sp. 423]
MMYSANSLSSPLTSPFSSTHQTPSCDMPRISPDPAKMHWLSLTNTSASIPELHLAFTKKPMHKRKTTQSIKFYMNIFSSAEELAQAQQMAHNTVDYGVFPDPNVGPMELAQAVQSLNKAVAKAQWTFKELWAFQAHASKWYNNLQGNWLFSDVPTDLPTLVHVVKGLIHWSNETMGMIKALQTKHKAFWEKHVILPFELKHTVLGMKYRFGCPSVTDEPDGLQDAFSHAKALLEGNATPVPSVGGSEAQVEDQVMVDLVVGNTTPGPDQQEMELETITMTPTTPVITLAAFAAPTTPTAPTIPAAPAAPATPATPAAPAAPATPAASTASAAPTAPATLVAPIAPAAPATPAAPAAPTAPAAPAAAAPLPAPTPVIPATFAMPIKPTTATMSILPTVAAPTSEAPITCKQGNPMPPPTPTTTSSASMAPSMISVSSTTSPIDPVPVPKASSSKRKHTDEHPEPPTWRTSKCLSTTTPTDVLDLPKTRAAATKATELNVKVVGKKGTNMNWKNGGLKHTK